MEELIRAGEREGGTDQDLDQSSSNTKTQMSHLGTLFNAALSPRSGLGLKSVLLTELPRVAVAVVSGLLFFKRCIYFFEKLTYREGDRALPSATFTPKGQRRLFQVH